MVRVKQKKAKGDDAFEKRKQKTGRKKLQPVTDTRAEVHARSLFISTAPSISRAAQSLNAPSFEKEGAYDESVSSFLGPRALKKQTVHELLRGITHYKSSQRASCFAGVCRLLLQTDKKRKKERVEEAARNTLGFPFRKSSLVDRPSHTDPNSVVKPPPDDEETQERVEPIEKLTVFTAALEAMTDTEEAVRAAALSVLQALFREGWVCPQTPQEDALEDQMLVYRYTTSHPKDGPPSPPEWTTTSNRDVVWMLVSSHAASKSSSGKPHTGHRPNNERLGKESSPSPRAASSLLQASSLSTPIPPVCAALCTLHANRAVPVLQQAAVWWREEVGVVTPEALFQDSVVEDGNGCAGSSRRTGGVSLPFGEGLRSRQAPHVGKESGELRRAAQKVALENVTAILHTIYICLTHAFYPVRCTGIELLESLLLLLQLESKRVLAQGGVDHFQGLFRQACRMVRRKQPLSGGDVPASLPPIDHPGQIDKGKEKHLKNDAASVDHRGRTAEDRQMEVLYVDEIWMLHLLRRVSHMVLRTPHVPVLASVVDALFLSTPVPFPNDDSGVGGRAECVAGGRIGRGGPKGEGKSEEENPVDILASLMRNDGSPLSSSVLSSATHPLRALWSAHGSTTVVVASPSEWCHAHLVQSAFAHVFLSPWSIAWKELMDQQVDLLRQEHAMGRAVALARAVGTIATFLHLRDASFSSTSGHSSSTHALSSPMDWEMHFPSPFLPSAAPLVPPPHGNTTSASSPTLAQQRATQRAKVKHALHMQEKKCQQALVDHFVRHVPFSLPALLQNETEAPAARMEATSPERAEDGPLSSSSSSSSLPSAPTVVDPTTRKTQGGCGAKRGKKRSPMNDGVGEEGVGNTRGGGEKERGGRKRERSASMTMDGSALSSSSSSSPRSSHATVSPALLRHRFAFAQALATIAATRMRCFPEASKLVFQYFSILFSPSVSSKDGVEGRSASSADKPADASVAPLEVLSDALGVLLLVLQLHPPCPAASSSAATALSWDRASNPTLEGHGSTRERSTSAAAAWDTSAALRRRQQREMQDLQIYHKALLCAPGVVAVVLKAMTQHHSRLCYRFHQEVEGSGEWSCSSTVAMPAPLYKTAAVGGREGKSGMNVYDRLQFHLMASGVEACQSDTTVSLSSTDSALAHLLLGVRQLLLALAQSAAVFLHVQQIPSLSTYEGRKKTVQRSGVEMEVFKSFHRVWRALPRFLFSLRLQWSGGSPPRVLQDDNTSEEATRKKKKIGEQGQALQEDNDRSKGEKEKEKKSYTNEEKTNHTGEEKKSSSDGSSLKSSSFSSSEEERVAILIGPLPSHSALIDLIVFSYLHAMWFLIRRHHPLLECSSKEAEAVKGIPRREGGRTGAVAENAPSCLEVLASTLPSLKGFRLPPSSCIGKTDEDGKLAVVHGVLSRCTHVTRRLAQRLAFYLHDTSSDFLMQKNVLDPVSGKDIKEVASFVGTQTMCEMDMVCVEHYLQSLVCNNH